MFILAVRGGFTQGGEKIQCQNKIQGKTFGISTIISPVNALDLSQVSTLFENQSKLSKCLMNTSVRKHSNLAVLPFMLFLSAGKPISNLQNV